MMPLEFREKIIANIRKKTLENAKLLSELAVEDRAWETPHCNGHQLRSMV